MVKELDFVDVTKVVPTEDPVVLMPAVLLLEDMLLWTLELLDGTNVEDAVDGSLVALVIEAVTLEIVLLAMELLAGVTDANGCTNDAHDIAQEMP
jgi:hypothetical protein